MASDSHLRKIARAIVTRARIAVREFKARRQAPFASKFETRAPAHANAVEIFSGRWATDLSAVNPEWKGGGAQLLADPRPAYAAQYLGNEGLLTGMTVLELGPLEGAHTSRLEQLGAARIVAIEANVEGYLKCLIMKEALGLRRAEFMLGDFSAYLRTTTERFGLVFASGVLYHMEDPLALIRDMARASDRCFVWTHYYDERRAKKRAPIAATTDGFRTTYFRAGYEDRAQAHFWGGNKPSASWMRRDDIIAAFRHFGLDDIKIVADDADASPAPAITFAAKRTTRDGIGRSAEI